MKHYYILVIVFLSLLTSSIGAQNSNKESEDQLLFKWLVSNVEELPVGDGHFIALPGLGLFLEDGSIFYSLDSIRCPDIVKFKMKAKLQFENAVISKEDFLVKSRELVVRIHKDETSVVAELDTETFFLHAGSGSKYHLEILEADGTWGWYTCDWTNGEMTCVVRTPNPISHILDNGEEALCVMGNHLYALKGVHLQTVATLPDYILDVVITNRGLFLCTEKMLYFYDGNTSPTPVLQGDFHSLHFDGKVFYIVLQDGRILKTDI